MHHIGIVTNKFEEWERFQLLAECTGINFFTKNWYIFRRQSNRTRRHSSEKGACLESGAEKEFYHVGMHTSWVSSVHSNLVQTSSVRMPNRDAKVVNTYLQSRPQANYGDGMVRTQTFQLYGCFQGWPTVYPLAMVLAYRRRQSSLCPCTQGLNQMWRYACECRHSFQSSLRISILSLPLSHKVWPAKHQ